MLRTLKYIYDYRYGTGIFVCFRSSGGNTIEIMQKSIENYRVRQVLQVLRTNESYYWF